MAGKNQHLGSKTSITHQLPLKSPSASSYLHTSKALQLATSLRPIITNRLDRHKNGHNVTTTTDFTTSYTHSRQDDPSVDIHQTDHNNANQNIMKNPLLAQLHS
jgi:hypothetical protein